VTAPEAEVVAMSRELGFKGHTYRKLKSKGKSKISCWQRKNKGYWSFCSRERTDQKKVQRRKEYV